MKIFVKKLNRWYQAEKRELPWRLGVDPYKTWISEIMLQQTQVKTVIPYFKRWMNVFPNVKKLADASESQVFELWAGLGYYSRARNILKGAQFIVSKSRIQSEKMVLPRTRDEWLEIPGVGEYTAGAICSISLGQYEPIVDGNVVRVFARIHGLKVISQKKEEVWKWARQYIETVRQLKLKAGDANQALMELGATICTPKRTQCSVCPVQVFCKGQNNPSLYPTPKSKVWKSVAEENVLLLKKDFVFLVKSEPGGWRAGLWDLPNEIPKAYKKTAKKLDENKIKLIVTQHKITRTVIRYGVHESAKNIATKSTHEISGWFHLKRLPPHGAALRKSLAAFNP